MSLKVFKLRLFFVYTLIIITFLVYIFGKTYIYQLQLNQNNLSSDISQLQMDLEEANVRINTLISRESITDDYPDLKLESDNVYYLERIQDEQ